MDYWRHIPHSETQFILMYLFAQEVLYFPRLLTDASFFLSALCCFYVMWWNNLDCSLQQTISGNLCLCQWFILFIENIDSALE